MAKVTMKHFLRDVAERSSPQEAGVIITLAKGVKNPEKELSEDQRILVTLGLDQFLRDKPSDWIKIITFLNSF